MIAFYRSASIAQGKVASALAFAKEISAHIKDKAGVDVSIAVPIGGNPNRIAYVSTYPNLAEFEAASTKLVADADYQKLVAANAANTIPGSVHDELWRSL